MLNVLLRAGNCLAMGAALAFGSQFSGSVVDASSGKPIPNAIVTSGLVVTRADAKSQFRIEANGTGVSARA